MKIYRVGETSEQDFFAAESKEQLLSHDETWQQMGLDRPESDEVFELTDEELDTFKYRETDDQCRPIGKAVTFRAQLSAMRAEGAKLPVFFATDNM